MLTMMRTMTNNDDNTNNNTSASLAEEEEESDCSITSLIGRPAAIDSRRNGRPWRGLGR